MTTRSAQIVLEAESIETELRCEQSRLMIKRSEEALRRTAGALASVKAGVTPDEGDAQ